MLKKLLDAKNIICRKHNIDSNTIVAYLHYHPSFYILHIHYVLVDNCKNGFGRNIFLSDIIKNIKIKSDYYQTVNIELIE